MGTLSTNPRGSTLPLTITDLDRFLTQKRRHSFHRARIALPINGYAEVDGLLPRASDVDMRSTSQAIFFRAGAELVTSDTEGVFLGLEAFRCRVPIRVRAMKSIVVRSVDVFFEGGIIESYEGIPVSRWPTHQLKTVV